MPGRDGFNIADYVTVAERRAELRDVEPSSFGSYLRPVDLKAPFTVLTMPDGAAYVVVVTGVYYRDEQGREHGPYGVGMAYEPYPGPTSFTRESELQNAETASWGRAIVANGAADTKRGIASTDEIQARHGNEAPRTGPAMTRAQRTKLDHLAEERVRPDGFVWPVADEDAVTMRLASGWIDQLERQPRTTAKPERRSTLRDTPPGPAPDVTPEDRPAPPEAPTGMATGHEYPLGAIETPSQPALVVEAESVALRPRDGYENALERHVEDANRLLPRASDQIPPWRRRPFPFGDPPSRIAAYWTIAYKYVPGIAHVRFLAKAQEIASERGLPVPLAVGDVDEPELVDAVCKWLDSWIGVDG